MLDYSDISGCYIIRPWGYSIWSHIQSFMRTELERRGIQDAYFPLLISETALRREQEHIAGFAPEVAWVTHAGQEELGVKLAVRPTSETAMYPAYAKWIRTQRDLPLRLNQWCNVVRWEFKSPQPFIRSREFLWQEGHSAFATKAEADAEVRDILDLYKRVFEDLLAVPVTQGLKSQSEKFAGADYTTTVEAFIPKVGRAIQGATSHGLGQNFARMFGISFEGKDPRQYVWQTSWGFTTRSIGIAVMTHGDDMGLVLPPRVASTQVVIIPVGITINTNASLADQIRAECQRIADDLKHSGIRAVADLTSNHTAGWKFSHWELKGVPIRIEVGPKELLGSVYRACIRHDGSKTEIPKSTLTEGIAKSLDEIHEAMLAKAHLSYNDSIISCTSWKEMVSALESKKMVLIPWCETRICEASIKERTKTFDCTGAKSLCIPFEQPHTIDGMRLLKCVACDEPASNWALFGRSY